MKLLRMTSLLAALALALTACGGDGEGQAASDKPYNQADVAFATEMIPHHAQALAMVDMTIGRDLDPAVRRLTEEIRAAQAPEIEQMAGWLRDWDKPVPPTMRDHLHADDHGDGSAGGMDGMDGNGMDGNGMGGMDGNGMGGMEDMPGMMSGEDFARLKGAPADRFQTMWLRMMIEHHEGAVQMARTEQEEGRFEPALRLARSIESSQEAEIAQMRKLLGDG